MENKTDLHTHKSEPRFFKPIREEITVLRSALAERNKGATVFYLICNVIG